MPGRGGESAHGSQVVQDRLAAGIGAQEHFLPGRKDNGLCRRTEALPPEFERDVEIGGGPKRRGNEHVDQAPREPRSIRPCQARWRRLDGPARGR